MAKEEFINAGYTIVGTENNENELLSFLKENYPNVIRDTEINIEELKTVLGLPIDEKVNGYGLNFVGRNFARAKYAQKTEKEIRLNTSLSKNFDATQNLVLKGDNLDSLKILKNHYNGQIKCIYIDPPYNTTSEEFVYPDKFDKEEAEVLGLVNLSESDFERMEFSFKTKRSHNGWLAFMYPRLLLARDLLSKDGVIFISIDDNEQANLKLLCDDIFGEENFIGGITWLKKRKGSFLSKQLVSMTEYVLIYSKDKSNSNTYLFGGVADETESQPIIKRTNQASVLKIKPNVIKTKLDGTYKKGVYGDNVNPVELLNDVVFTNGYNLNEFEIKAPFTWSQDFFDEELQKGSKPIINTLNFQIRVFRVNDEDSFKGFGSLIDGVKIKGTNEDAYEELESLLGLKKVFDYSKPKNLMKELVIASTKFNDNAIVLDFFAGSGTTGHAVMELNKDGGNRKFILCQIDEPIKEDKPAYQFCIDNNLPPVISSITIERLKRAGEIIAKDIEAENSKSGMFEEHKKQVPDIGFKAFDSVDAPKLKVDETGQISITENETDALSRIYNMIFTVGLDEPTQVPEMVVENCIYKIGNHYYITNSEQINSDDYSNAIKNGKVFIDGWTASLNGTLQNYKEDVKIVF